MESSRQRKLLLIFILVAAIALGLYLRASSRPSSSVGMESEGEGSTLASPTPLSSPSASPSPITASSMSQKTPDGPLEFPTLKEVREQIAKDPHETPPALIQFAKDLSERSETAKQSPEKAKEFFGSLEDCLRGGKEQSESVPVAAQTLCLTTAEEFVKLYPDELSSRMPAIEQNLSPEVKRIRNALRQF